MQTTIRSAVTFTGAGLHSGLRARMTVHPASAEYGIWFRRTDVIGRDAMVQAHWSAVENAKLCHSSASMNCAVSNSDLPRSASAPSNLAVELANPNPRRATDTRTRPDHPFRTIVDCTRRQSTPSASAVS